MNSIFICGDIVNLTNDSQFIDENLISVIRNADFSIGNLEGPISNGSNVKKNSILQNASTVRSLKQAGFDMLLLANNHISDYGKEGISSTLDIIKKENILSVGAGLSYEEAYRYEIVDINNTKIGIINISTAQIGQFGHPKLQYGYAWMGDVKVDERIKTLRDKVDIMLLFCHVGFEHYSIPLVEIRELYYHYCDIGVDCVIGGHPHVPQGYESYNSSLIIYSLGNFYFPENVETGKEQESYSVVLKCDKDIHSFDIIYHKTSQRMVHLETETNISFSLKDLNAMLQEPLYSNLCRRMYEEGFEHYFQLYQGCFLGINYNIFERALRKIGIKVQRKNIEVYMNQWLKMTNCEVPRYILSHYLYRKNEQE